MKKEWHNSSDETGRLQDVLPVYGNSTEMANVVCV